MKNSKELDSNEISNTYKCLYRDTDTGKVIVTDYNNNQHETDIFGRKLKFFLPNISGMLSGVNRSNLSLKMNNSRSVNNISDNNNLNIGSNKKSFYFNYTPGIKKIDGYGFIPKPISVPFFNEDSSLLSKKMKNQLNDNLKKYYSKDNEKIQKNNNFRISYFSKDLSNEQAKIKDEKQIMNLINKSIEELKGENKIRLNSVEKNPKYIALNRFKTAILENNKKSIYSNFKEAPLEIKDKYNILRNVIKNRLNEIKKKQNLVEKKEKEYLNKYNKIKKINSLFEIPKKKYIIKNIIIGPDKLNDICRSKDFSIGRTIKMDFGNQKEKENEKEKIISQENNIDNENKIEVQNNKINNILPKIVKRINSGNKSNLYQDTDTAETNTHMNRNNSDIILERNKSYDELSFISRETEKNEVKKNKRNNFRSLKSVKSNAELEKELLKGIKMEPPKEEINNNKIHQTKVVLKTEGQLYRENLELLKITNKKQYELQKQKDEYDLFLLKKKLGNKKKLSLALHNEIK